LTNQLPAHLQQYQVPDLGATLSANLGAAMPPHVNIGNGRFTLVDAAGNEIMVPTFDPKLGPYLDACIVDVADVKSRIYYEGAYDSTAEGKRPVCYSDNGVGPSTGSSVPQAPTCAICPRAEWTKINANGNKIPWCTEKYKVALLLPGFPTLFMLAVPPASHGPLREYTALCKGNGALVANLITRMWFTSQGVLGFHATTYIDVAVAQLRQEAYAQKKTDILVGRGDVARPAGAIAAPQTMQIAPQNTGAFAPQQQIPQNTGQFVQQPSTQAQQPSQQWPQQGTTQQVQQPAPFGGTGPMPAHNAPAPGPSTQNAAPFAATTSPSEQLATGRRKRRTQAEITAANGAGPAVSGGAQQAPFPHPGQVQQPGPFTTAPTAGGPFTQTSGAAPTAVSSGQQGNAQQLEFGIGQGQDANADPALKGMLDNFFTQGGQT
jgi:hypothetical protein